MSPLDCTCSELGVASLELAISGNGCVTVGTWGSALMQRNVTSIFVCELEYAPWLCHQSCAGVFDQDALPAGLSTLNDVSQSITGHDVMGDWAI